MPKLIDPLPQLTERQWDVLYYIFGEFKKNQKYPSKSKIVRHFGVKTNNSSALVAPLFKKGVLRAVDGMRGQYFITARGVEVIEDHSVHIPEEFLAKDDQLELKTGS